jgi:hypothetical protein
MRKRHLPFPASEDLLAGGVKKAELPKLTQINLGRHHSLNIPAPSDFLTPRQLIKCRRCPPSPVTASTNCTAKTMPLFATPL